MRHVQVANPAIVSTGTGYAASNATISASRFHRGLLRSDLIHSDCIRKFVCRFAQVEDLVQKQRWAVVLAAGSGTRLQELTSRPGKNPVPKQFCSLDGGASLLRLALARAHAVVPNDRVLCVVADEHEQWWSRELDSLPAANIIVQPTNRGTGVGTLLPLLVARSRDPWSRLVFFPADQYMADEAILTRAIKIAYQALESDARRVLLLGLEPDAADPGLGYILSSGHSRNEVRSVSRFFEKPTSQQAARLIKDGALWNSFVFVAQCETLLRLFRDRIPGMVKKFETVFENRGTISTQLSKMYQMIDSVDLSRTVFAGAEDKLAVLRVPSCGWSDLGTPERVIRCLSGDGGLFAPVRSAYPCRPTHINLSVASHSIGRSDPL